MISAYRIDKFKAAVLFYSLLQCVLLIKFYILGNFRLAYYFCYHAPALFAFAFYKRNIPFIRALIIVGFVGQVIWLMDYFSYISFGNFILGNSKFILRYHGIPYIATLLSHMMSSLLALALIYKSEISIKSIFYAYCYFILFYFLNIIHLIPESYNVNFVWEFEGFDVFPFYTQLYLFYVIPLALLPGYYIQIFVRRIFK